MSQRDDYTNYCDRCLTGTGVHTCGEKPEAKPEPMSPAESKAYVTGYQEGSRHAREILGERVSPSTSPAVERVQPEPATLEQVFEKWGPVLERLADGAKPKGEPAPSTSVEPQVEPQSLLKAATALCEGIERCSSKEFAENERYIRQSAAVLRMAADSVSHPLLEQEARERRLSQLECAMNEIKALFHPFDVQVDFVGLPGIVKRIYEITQTVVRERSKRA